MKETRLPLYSKYILYEDGIVYSDVSSRFLKLHSNNGYVMVFLTSDAGVGRWHYVHRLLAQAFILNPYDKPEVNHIDRDRSNNALSNLEWVTHAENLRHARTTGPAWKPSTRANWHVSEETRRKMRLAKVGTKHPKFKGWHLTPDGRKHASVKAAAQYWSRKTKLNFYEMKVRRYVERNVMGFSFLPLGT